MLGLYRSVMRARQMAFVDDVATLAASRERIASTFRDNRGETDPEKLADMQEQGEDMARMLKHHVLQAVAKDDGNFHMKVPKAVVEGPPESS